MQEHKFKLKKDGEVVGYAFIGNGQVITAETQEKLDRAKKNCASYSVALRQDQWDTAESFVCLDKNKDEVYTGDEAEIYYESSIGHFSSEKGKIYWDEKELCWMINDYQIRHSQILASINIELIKKEKD